MDQRGVVILSVSRGGSEERVASTAVVLAVLLGVELDEERARELLREAVSNGYARMDGDVYRLTAEGERLYASLREELKRLRRNDALSALEMIELISIDDLKELAHRAGKG